MLHFNKQTFSNLQGKLNRGTDINVGNFQLSLEHLSIVVALTGYLLLFNILKQWRSSTEIVRGRHRTRTALAKLRTAEVLRRLPIARLNSRPDGSQLQAQPGPNGRMEDPVAGGRKLPSRFPALWTRWTIRLGGGSRCAGPCSPLEAQSWTREEMAVGPLQPGTCQNIVPLPCKQITAGQKLSPNMR